MSAADVIGSLPPCRRRGSLPGLLAVTQSGANASLLAGTCRRLCSLPLGGAVTRTVVGDPDGAAGDEWVIRIMSTDQHRPGPLVTVLYARGAAGPTDIRRAAAGLANVQFACRSDDSASLAIKRVLAANAPVVWYDSADQLAAVAKRSEAVLTFSESRLLDLGLAIDASGLPGPSSAVVKTLTHKPSQRSAMAFAGLPVPQWATANTRAGIVEAWNGLGRKPCVVKPAVGVSSGATFRMASARDIADIELPETDYIIEEMLIGAPTGVRTIGDYCSVETVSSRGKHEAVAIVPRMPLRPPFREVGGFLPPALEASAQSRITQEALRAIEACGVTDGVCHVEIKLTEAGPRLIEVNGRLGGNVADLVRMHSGRDLVRDALLCALGVAPPRMSTAEADSSLVFRWFAYADVNDGTLRAVNGLEKLRELKNVKAVKQLLRSGDLVDWRLGSDSALFYIDGYAKDHAELERVLEQVEKNFVVVVDKRKRPRNAE